MGCRYENKSFLEPQLGHFPRRVENVQRKGWTPNRLALYRKKMYLFKKTGRSAPKRCTYAGIIEQKRSLLRNKGGQVGRTRLQKTEKYFNLP